MEGEYVRLKTKPTQKNEKRFSWYEVEKERAYEADKETADVEGKMETVNVRSVVGDFL